MPFCQNCGLEYQSKSNFCPSCGQRVAVLPDIQGVPIFPTEKPTKIEEITIWEGKSSGLIARCKWIFNTRKYILTNLRLIERAGLIRRTEKQIELIRIKDLQLNQGLKDRILGVGDILIASTDESDPHFELKNIKNPIKVKDLIWKTVRAEREKHVRYIGSA